MDIFLVKPADIPTDVQLPKSTNLLLKSLYRKFNLCLSKRRRTNGKLY